METSDFKFLQETLLKKSGLSIGEDKVYLLETRLRPILKKENLNSMSELVSKLKSSSLRETPLMIDVVEAMTTNESFFFRDKSPFDYFSKKILPELARKKAASKKIRIWCAACSTGQEPYSLGICIKELASEYGYFNFEIVGTDISHVVLNKAKQGIYSQFEVQRGVPVSYLLKYFTQQGEQWQVNADIRSMITFRHLNLLDHYLNMGDFDLVLCRNVLIYFDAETKVNVLSKIKRCMSEGAYLMIGAPETLVGLSEGDFTPLKDARGVYQFDKSKKPMDMAG